MRIGLVALLALLLSACGSKTGEEAAAKQRAATASARVPADDEVAAVLESAGTPLARLRFVVDSRPVVGQSFNLKLIVSADTAVPQLLATAESGELVVDPASVALALGESGSGAGHEYSASHVFSVTARQEGLAELTVHLTADPDTPEALYVIPVLVAKPGAAAAPASDKPDPATAGNHAQPKKG